MAKYEILSPARALPAGRYYIGDPCYVIPHDEWSDALQATRFFNMVVTDAIPREYNPKDRQNGVFARDGVLFAASSTQDGDGCYPLVNPRGDVTAHLGVDAGLIAAVPVSMIDPQLFADNPALGMVIEFAEPFRVEYDAGTIWFGPWQVVTGEELRDYGYTEDEEEDIDLLDENIRHACPSCGAPTWELHCEDCETQMAADDDRDTIGREGI